MKSIKKFKEDSERVRKDWDKKFINEIKKNGQPERLMPDFFDDENFDDWTWEEE